MAPRHRFVLALLSAAVLGAGGGAAYLAWPGPAGPDPNRPIRVSAPAAPPPKAQARPAASPEAIRQAEAALAEGLAAYQRADYDTALRIFTLLSVNDIGTNRYMNEAYYRLGLIHGTGFGDRAEAVSHFAVAAEAGHVKAQLRLSEAYFLAVGVPFDYVRAYMWSVIAAKLGGDPYDNDIAIGNRDDLTEFIPPADIAKAKRLAAEWLAKFDKRKAR